MSIEHAVHYAVERPARFTRLQLAARLVAFLALGVLGLTFGTLMAFAYLALPVFAATRIASRGPVAYLDEDGPLVTRVLAWLAAISAWTGLVAEHLPARDPDETVHLAITRAGQPTPSSALWRVVTGIPSVLVLALLGCIGCLVWLWAAITVLVDEKIGAGAFGYLVGLQRWALRLLAYQASLVEEYPPFSFEDEPIGHVPAARVAP